MLSKEIWGKNLSVWHKILGHCNIIDIKSLENVAEGFEIINKINDEIN